MRYLAFTCLFALCACESVRTVYDENGNVVDPDAPSGGESDLASRFEKDFASSFSEKKNALGVPQATSNKVSSFQKDLDSSSRLNKDFQTGAFAGSDNQVQTMSFSGSGKSFSTKEAYTGGLGHSISKDLHPAFATASRGVFGSDDAYSGNSRYGYEGKKSVSASRVYSTQESVISRESTSGYFETRRGNTPPPRIMTRDQYYRKTIEETRAMLGRSNDKAED